jgi:hypothetical protein
VAKNDEKDLPIINSKSTKQEVMDAYEAACKQLAEKAVVDPRQEAVAAQNIETTKRAATHTTESISSQLTGLKLVISKSLDVLGADITQELGKLTDLRTSVTLEQDKLTKLYQITAKADSLTALILAHKEKEAEFTTDLDTRWAAFNKDIADKKDSWRLEILDRDRVTKESVDLTAKMRKRDEEQYIYELQIARKKDNDAYEIKRLKLENDLQDLLAKFNKEIDEREKVIEIREAKVDELEAKVAAFPEELQKALAAKAAEVKGSIESNYKHGIELTAKIVEGEMKLKDQTILSLTQKVADLTELNTQLTLKVNESSNQVQSIAFRAIEGASNQRVVIAPNSFDHAPETNGKK